VDVALKSIKLDDDDLDSGEFEHEASLLSSLRFPHIVTFWGVCLSDTNKFMVMEYLHGGSLDGLIYDCKAKRKRLGLAQKLHILSDIASGMSYLHEDRESPIMHRDLKPGNILLTSDLTAKVTDFGLSKLTDSSHNSSRTSQIGTLLYMAPEILLGEYYDETCDVFSYSIIMWQLLFDETNLFSSSCVQDEKYNTFMSEKDIQRFSSMQTDALILIPRLITEGLRPPIPSLPIDVNNPKIRKWIQNYFLFMDLTQDGQYQPNVMDTYGTILSELFALMKQCWDRQISLRPSFRKITQELTRLEKCLK